MRIAAEIANLGLDIEVFKLKNRLSIDAAVADTFGFAAIEYVIFPVQTLSPTDETAVGIAAVTLQQITASTVFALLICAAIYAAPAVIIGNVIGVIGTGRNANPRSTHRPRCTAVRAARRIAAFCAVDVRAYFAFLAAYAVVPNHNVIATTVIDAVIDGVVRAIAGLLGCIPTSDKQ